MRSDLVARYSAPVPRYTSYPTAPHFHEGVSAATYRGWLGAIGEERALSLYLHVPFCHEMCWYCGCHTKVVRRYDPIGAYAALLGRELELVAAAIGSRPRVAHVHWGGGTPVILSPADFGGLMAAIGSRFRLAEGAEVAVEVDPRNLSDETVQALAAAGVTRASLGVQDFAPHVQAAINRIQPYEVTASAVERLRAAGIRRINFDLMYGLPGQSLDDVLRTIDLAARLGPDRLAVFGYAHVPWMKSHQKMIDEAALPGPAERFEHAEAAAARLVERGYRRIGLDHFARPDDPMSRAQADGRLRRNFQGYTTDEAETLLGFGASAIGSLFQGYVQNAAPLRDYGAAVRDDCLAVVRGLRLSLDDRLRRAVIDRLMCDLEVDLAGLSLRFNAGDAHFGDELEALKPMADDGLVEIAGQRVRVTERGRPFLRSLCAQFDSYLKLGRARHSSGL